MSFSYITSNMNLLSALINDCVCVCVRVCVRVRACVSRFESLSLFVLM